MANTSSNLRGVTVRFVDSEVGYELVGVETAERFPEDLGINIDDNTAKLGLTLAPEAGAPPELTGLDIVRTQYPEAIEARAASGRCTSSSQHLMRRLQPLR